MSSHGEIIDESLSIEPESPQQEEKEHVQLQQHHHQPVPQVVLQHAPQSSHQEKRLEDVRRVRDEAEGLRREICQLRIRLEEVEGESKFNAAKANELTELLCNSNSGASHDLVLQQSEELAKRACQIESLEKKITNSTTEKALLEIERDKAKKETVQLSSVVRSLQNVTTLSMDHKDGENDTEGGNGNADDDDDSDDEEIVLTPETALDLTLGNLKDHIEMLEDGLQGSSHLNAIQKQKIDALEKDNQLNQVKIGTLEELFRELNVNDRDFYEKRAVETDKNNKDNKNFAKKAAQESSNKNTDANANAINEDPVAREHNLKRHGLIERLRGAFITTTSTTAAAVDPNIAIPEEAAAAAKAAALLMGSLHGSRHGGSFHGILSRSRHGKDAKGDGNANGSGANGSTRKKSSMKKVKIRFKKAGLEGTYTGPLVNKRPHGVGTIRFTNGDTYLGEMTHGKMSGTGTLYTKTRGVFRGQFANNRFVGEKQGDKENIPGGNASTGGGASTSSNKSITSTSSESIVSTKEQSANAVAAMELDGFSPTTITGSQDIMDGIEDMVVGADSMDLEHSEKMDSMMAEAKQQENDAFLKELEGVDADNKNDKNNDNDNKNETTATEENNKEVSGHDSGDKQNGNIINDNKNETTAAEKNNKEVSENYSGDKHGDIVNDNGDEPVVTDADEKADVNSTGTSETEDVSVPEIETQTQAVVAV